MKDAMENYYIWTDWRNKQEQEDQGEEEDDDEGDDCKDMYGYGGIVENRSLRRFKENSDMAKAIYQILIRRLSKWY